MTACDVYAYGVIASSELHLLSMPFPSPDGYAEIAESHFMTGGEALNSAIVLSRLGLSVRLDGNWIGDTPAGERLLATIHRYGIDAQRLRVKEGFAGVPAGQPPAAAFAALTNVTRFSGIVPGRTASAVEKM